MFMRVVTLVTLVTLKKDPAGGKKHLGEFQGATWRDAPEIWRDAGEIHARCNRDECEMDARFGEIWRDAGLYKISQLSRNQSKSQETILSGGFLRSRTAGPLFSCGDIGDKTAFVTAIKMQKPLQIRLCHRCHRCHRKKSCSGGDNHQSTPTPCPRRCHRLTLNKPSGWYGLVRLRYGLGTP